MIRPIVQDSCATLRPSTRGLVETSRRGLNKHVSKILLIGSIDVEIHVNTTDDSVTLRFSRCAPSEDGGASIKSEDVVDQGRVPRSLNYRDCFLFISLSINCDPSFLYLHQRSRVSPFAFNSLDKYYILSGFRFGLHRSSVTHSIHSF